MRIAGLRLKNWGPYRNEHELVLGPGAYAVLARYASDPERSNFAGKSMLLESIRFALFGDHRHRLEDGWISEGEDEGSVSLTTDDGPSIVRSRKRGKSTVLQVGKAKGDEAQKLIVEAIGMGQEEFDCTAWIGQGQVAQLVTADPAPRTRMVAGWLGLGKLQEAEGHNASALGGAVAALESAKANVAAAEEQCRSVGSTADALRVRIGEIGALLAEQERFAEERNVNMRGLEARARFEQVATEGKALAAKLNEGKDVPDSGLKDEVRRLDQEHAVASREVEQRRRLHRGQWDGECPLSRKQCPASDEVRAEVRDNGVRLQEVEDRASSLFDEYVKTEKAADVALATNKERERIRWRMGELRKEVDRLRPMAQHAAVAPAFDDQRPALQREAGELRAKVGILEAANERIRQAELQVAGLEQRVAALRQAAAILGRAGAQKRVARAGLGKIEMAANRRLVFAGADLQVEVRWEVEGKDPAKNCGACGWPFPDSAKVKECPKCGAARGRQMQNKLEFLRSRQSGGADDLASLALQLSAARWRREHGGARWATGLLDEASAQLDASHRKALGRMLANDDAFEQMLCVSHHVASLDALPHRIEITSDGKWAKAKVVA